MEALQAIQLPPPHLADGLLCIKTVPPDHDPPVAMFAEFDLGDFRGCFSESPGGQPYRERSSLSWGFNFAEYRR